MSRLSLAVVLSAGSLLAQANAVPGTDILMYELTDISYEGRRGAAFPNGEAGFMVGHSWCNSGTVNLPWLSQSGGLMVDNYPRIAFLLVRESGGRMVQVSGRSFCKHSPTAYNFQTGPCLPCTGGGGAFFYVGCSDTYGSGTNASQYALGPTHEIDPWLGTWNPQGSYFDRGDPSVGGAQAIDSVRSLTFQQVQAFDVVKNRITVREGELLAGANYYAQVYAMVKTEPMIERDNNAMNRQVSITASGASWSANAVGNSMNGSVLTRWTGATSNIGSNYPDDGRFQVAVKVTGPAAGMYHYEYAIHNLDNNRGGASFRVPLAPGAQVQNGGFRDLDTDPLNDWTFSQTASEIAFTASANNPLDWNTIYNCWFDCSIPPGAGSMSIDQARTGAGALTVTVPSEVPSGMPFANKYPVGTACGACQSAIYENFTTLGTFDLAGRSMTMTLNGGAYTVQETPVSFVPASGTNLGLAMSTQTTVSLPFTLPYPGGTTTQLHVGSSGYVSPGSANPIQIVGSPQALVTGNARWAPAWTAWTPQLGANVFFDASPTRAILTWNGVTCLAGTGTSTFQIQFFPDGTVHTVWQSIGQSPLPVLVGWAPGGGQTVPLPRDLSATLPTAFSLCSTSFDGLALDASAAPVLGTTLQWQLSG
ncbi:MAG TPA: hypothetical protein VFT55_08110, partial [Planctomycetota bacterium]|nr:hypothetical protein [Planctomycetota bacterium]